MFKDGMSGVWLKIMHAEEDSRGADSHEAEVHWSLPPFMFYIFTVKDKTRG